MLGTISPGEEAQLMQTIEMFEVITQSQPQDYQSLEILKEAYLKLARPKDVINTSKRIAQAYVQLGQLSSAILEYETILQSHPDDAEALAAMADIESKANSLTAMPAVMEPSPASKNKGTSQFSANDVDDGKSTMQKLFVESKLITQGEFDLCWVKPPLHESPGKVYEPFIQTLADKGICPIEKSLRLLSDKARLAYIPLDRYDIDAETVRIFPKDLCFRWCVLPLERMSKSVLVATANPYNKHATDELSRATHHRVMYYLCSPPELLKLIRKVCR
ncbi:MAG: Type fimbrial assembly, ATPase PilB [Verrucomicrobiales bacterium]|nr:Type fimbrial assembly, ATPase PilB [Verrucomicrobiales bacterium]